MELMRPYINRVQKLNTQDILKSKEATFKLAESTSECRKKKHCEFEAAKPLCVRVYISVIKQ